ncbi:hypothetical protein O5O51_07765 [Sinirhodobacter sp. HNIBRBA609]|nr:hypothetical protein O5O51_07765 [Sinirhodobacter sp. HNIBRBA609]
MSAIDWLSRSVVTPAVMGPGTSAAPRQPLSEPPVTEGVGTEDVAISSLDRPSANGLGLLPPSQTGLPPGLWGNTPETDLAEALRKERLDTLPAIQSLLIELLLAELQPPRLRAPDGRNVLFLARIDRLLDLGALEPALAMLEQSDPTDPEIFRRHFDVALLLGEEDAACEIMERTPSVAPSYSARIFCLARQGNWDTAVLTLGTGRALGKIDDEVAALLERFLEPELADDTEDLPPPSRPSPLVFRMMEAIGQPMPTGPLPVAFAQSDLRANTGWKARIEAAERLTRMGALDPNQLLGLYTERRAAASGGVWDRVRIIGDLDTALEREDTDALSEVLPAAYEAMQALELEPALAALYGTRVAQADLEGDAGALAFRLGLLTDHYQDIAAARSPANLDERLLIGIARGGTTGIPVQDQLGLALKQVFDITPGQVPAPYAHLVPGKLGEALLNAIDDITEGAKGDYRRLVAGLSLMRYVGLDDVARRTGLQLIILERRG